MNKHKANLYLIFLAKRNLDFENIIMFYTKKKIGKFAFLFVLGIIINKFFEIVSIQLWSPKLENTHAYDYLL